MLYHLSYAAARVKEHIIGDRRMSTEGRTEAFALCLFGAAEATPRDVAKSRSEVAAGAIGRLSTALCLP